MKDYKISTDYRLEPDETWNDATPQEIPEFTYWPFMLSIGLLFITWGIITHFALFAFGLILFVISLMGWIVDLRETYYETNYNEEGEIADES